MFGGKKRPWKKYAFIKRIERNSGDVKYGTGAVHTITATAAYGEFESLTEAEAHLDAWWADWWPKQTKSVRKA